MKRPKRKILKTKSFIKYLEKRLDKNEIEKIKKEAEHEASILMSSMMLLQRKSNAYE